MEDMPDAATEELFDKVKSAKTWIFFVTHEQVLRERFATSATHSHDMVASKALKSHAHPLRPWSMELTVFPATDVWGRHDEYSDV